MPVTRTGFTLLELLLAMTVFAAIAAIVIPAAGSLLSDRRLTRGTDQLRAELTRLRVRAMREGRVFVVQANAGAGNIEITAFQHAGDATEAFDQAGSQSSLLSGADQTIGVVNDTPEPSQRTIELPEQVLVDAVATSPVGGDGSIERASLLSGEVIESSIGDEMTGPALSPIYFYPNGQSSNAIVTLSHPDVGTAKVRVRGLTGDVTVQTEAP